MRHSIYLLMSLVVWCAGTAHAAPQPEGLLVGKSQFTFIDKKGDITRPIRVWMYVPVGCDTACPLQFVMHGVKRDGETYLGYWSALADESPNRKFIVIAPEFTREYFPLDDDYSLGRATVETDPEKWAFAVPEHLFDELKARFGLKATSYRLFGHSAGGQFVHRLHLFYPQHRAKPIIAANPGWYTQLEWGNVDTAFKFPYNTIGSKVDAARASQALKRSFVLMLGDADIDPKDASLNKSKGANAQGANRFQRGNRFFENAGQAAKKLSSPFAWQKIIVPNVAHQGQQMSLAAHQYMMSQEK
jgi:poly(3-hydroxybutyrate) depolymerase